MHIITSDDIKNVKKHSEIKSQFEPRLICKIDTREERPDWFKELGVCLLSVTNDSYGLIKGDIYQNIDNMRDVKITALDKNTESLILDIGNSETSMLDNLRYSGALENYILGEPILFWFFTRWSS